MYKIKEAQVSTDATNLWDPEVKETITEVITRVSKQGDEALLDYTREFDGIDISDPSELVIDRDELADCYLDLSPEIRSSLQFAREQIAEFAEQQMSCFRELEYQSSEGITLGHKVIPVSSCGCYVPGGNYPLPSSALMSIVPARVAGVENIIAVSPPNRDTGTIHREVLAAMFLAGVEQVYVAGGAQAIAALAFGTDTIPSVDMIVGPGNKFVTEAKRQLNGLVGIDQLAGPSEILILADESASAERIAADLLAQAEHDPDARCLLVTTSEKLASQVNTHVDEQLSKLKTTFTAKKSWEDFGEIIIAENLNEAVNISDDIAPEHLLLITEENFELVDHVKHYGSLFIGEYSSVAFGDYVSGTNHILPTGGSARHTSGLSVGKFLKVSSYQMIDQQGADKLVGDCVNLADLEGLDAHKRSAMFRKST